MNIKKRVLDWAGMCLLASIAGPISAQEQPVAIFHAFDQSFGEIEQFVCELGQQGYSHIQIPPAQKSNPSAVWWARYQPVDYGVIEGKGSEDDLRRLINKAHSCNVKVIADVVFNHMADLADCQDLKCFPDLSPEDFHLECEINYGDGNRGSEMNCWLGTLPDLDQYHDAVQKVHKAHIRKLLDLGIDGFRFDAAKHIEPNSVKGYIDYINDESGGKTWNYLEVIQDNDTKFYHYNWIAAVTDFILYNSMKDAFSYGGNLHWLRVPQAISDPRSVTFGRNHDTIKSLNDKAINPYNDPSDSYLATAYVLARERGTPLVFNDDNLQVPYIKHGVKFRQIMRERGKQGKDTKEYVLAVVEEPTVLVMERGDEGFFVVNKGTDRFNRPALDMTLSKLEGCYRELRNNFTVAIERQSNGKKYVTRWASWKRGGMEVYGRDALYFIRVSWDECRAR